MVKKRGLLQSKPRVLRIGCVLINALEHFEGFLHYGRFVGTFFRHNVSQLYKCVDVHVVNLKAGTIVFASDNLGIYVQRRLLLVINGNANRDVDRDRLGGMYVNTAKAQVDYRAINNVISVLYRDFFKTFDPREYPGVQGFPPEQVKYVEVITVFSES